MSPKLTEFTTDELKFALVAIQRNLEIVEYLNDEDEIAAGKCEQWDALTLWKVQLSMALDSREQVDKISSN